MPSSAGSQHPRGPDGDPERPAGRHGRPDDPEVTDAELLKAHCAGDPEAFTELVRRHRDRLWAVALRTTGDPEEAADALQDAFISAFRRADQFRGESAVTTWLHRIVVNASLDRMRRRAVRPWVPLPEEGGERGDPASLAAPRDAMDDRETSLEIQAALADLPPDQRAAVVLVDLEGWSVEDAARVLECPVGTVKSRCFRGRAKLADRLAHLRSGGSAPKSGNRDPDRAVPLPDHVDTRDGTDSPSTDSGGER
ncbi:MAG: RNA polymerase sigma factor SigM [bacterium]